MKFMSLLICVAMLLPTSVFAGEKYIGLDRVSLSLTGRNVVDLQYSLSWESETGYEAGLINGKLLKIVAMEHLLNDKDLRNHDTIFVDRYPTEISIDQPLETRMLPEMIATGSSMIDLAESITLVDRVYGNEYKRAVANNLEAQLNLVKSGMTNCTVTPQANLASGIVRLKKSEIEKSNLAIAIPNECNYWDVTEPLEISTKAVLKGKLLESGGNSEVRDFIGNIDLRYTVLISFEDASGFQYRVRFHTKDITRFDEYKSDLNGGESGIPNRQEIVGYRGFNIN